MAQHTYFLENDPAKTLTLRWGFNWKNLQVSYCDEPVGEIATKKALTEGREFQLPDNRTVSIKLKGSFMPQLEVLLNNEPVTGSATDPEAILRQIFKLSLVLGILNVVFGVAGTLLPNEFFQKLGFGTDHIFTGALVLALAFGIRKRSMIALIASLSFWVLDYGLGIFFSLQEPGGTNPGGLILRITVVYTLFRGIRALKQLNQQQPGIKTV
jgi:hypothetical protein